MTSAATPHELAYRDLPDDPRVVLSAMTEGQTDRVPTYLGLATRKSGDMVSAMDLYGRGLAQNPDNLMARSNMGPAFLEKRDPALAAAQRAEIRQRDGRGTWAEYALRKAIEGGSAPGYWSASIFANP